MGDEQWEGANADSGLELATVMQPAADHASHADLSEAEALLAYVWHQVAQKDPQFASHAAWGMAWQFIGGGRPEAAYRWFQHMCARAEADATFWAVVGAQLRDIWAGMLGSEVASDALEPAGAVCPGSAAALPLLTVRTLGTFEIIRGGALLPPCPSRKACAILRYLLTRRHFTASTSELAELLWPEVAPHRSIHNVHVAINALRRHIDQSGCASYILSQSGTYCINPAAPVVDQVAQFEHALSAARQAALDGLPAAAIEAYTHALALYEGDYFIDEHDQAWAAAERERILSLYLNGLQHCGDLMVELGALEPAIGAYTGLLARDPYREDVHEKVMLCYLKLGRRRDALHQYAQCAASLAEGLGLEPGPTLQALARCVCAHAGDRPAT